MSTLNTISLIWKTLDITENELPSPCYYYLSNILPNGTIVYVGGKEQMVPDNTTEVTMREVSNLNKLTI